MSGTAIKRKTSVAKKSPKKRMAKVVRAIKRAARSNTTKTILATLAAGGIITLAVALPNSIRLIDLLTRNRPTKQKKYHFNKVIERLINQKLIAVTREGCLCLTEKGRGHLARLEAEDYVIPKPKRWDGMFRVIIFDVPEEKRRIREALRNQLIVWGFVKLQNSVWVHPYECQEIVTLLKTLFGIGEDVLYLTVDSIENDEWLKQEFGID